MFTKPINLPQIENKPETKKSWFSGYVMCFLFLILCMLLILAYRVEVKIVQQNLRNNYEDYIEEIKKELKEQENIIILERNNYDAGQNVDYDDIDVDKFTKMEISTPSSKQDVTKSSWGDLVVTGKNDEDKQADYSSESESYEDFSTSAKTTPYSKTTEVPTKLSNSVASSKVSVTAKISSTTLQNKNTTKSPEITTKAIPMEVYITQSIKINEKTMPTLGRRNNSNKFYDPNRPGVILVKIEESDSINDESSSEKEQKYYEVPKKDEANSEEERLTTVRESEYSEEDDTSEEYKDKINNNKKEEKEFDPLNENIDFFNTNVDRINKIMDDVHKEMQKQISENMANIKKNLPMDIDLREFDPFYEETQKKTDSKKVDSEKGKVVVIGPVLE